MNETSECTGCHQFVPTSELSADDICEVCQRMQKLKDTLAGQGRLRPEQQATLPYKDEL